MNYTGQTSFADMFEYYCTRNVTNEREYNEREMLRWLKQQLQHAHREGWEQAKAEAMKQCNYQTAYSAAEQDMRARCCHYIAAMEYKGESK